MKHDPILIATIALAEADPATEADVTLVAGGFLISGFVISFQKYMKHHVIVEGTARALARVSEEDPANKDEPEASGRNFIHLRDAKYYMPGAPAVPGNTGVFCRIRLDAVTGFSFGKLESEQ